MASGTNVARGNLSLARVPAQLPSCSGCGHATSPTWVDSGTLAGWRGSPGTSGIDFHREEPQPSGMSMDGGRLPLEPPDSRPHL